MFYINSDKLSYKSLKNRVNKKSPKFIWGQTLTESNYKNDWKLLVTENLKKKDGVNLLIASRGYEQKL